MQDLYKYYVYLRNLYYQLSGNFYERNFLTRNILFNYFDNGKYNKEILIMLHGFSSNKEECLQIASNLSNKYRIIIPDLIGHGNTRTLDNKAPEVDLDNQLLYLYDFISHNIGNDKKVHIMGHSMGGLLAWSFSSRYPNLIKSINLICPAGISMINTSPVYDHYIQTNHNLLSLRTPNDVKNLLYLDYNKVEYVPEFIFNYYSEEYSKNYLMYDKIFKELIIDNYSTLDADLQNIQSKMLVLWGEDDKIINKSCIDTILNNIQVTANIFIIRKAGHTINTTHSHVCSKYIDLHIEKNLE